MFPRSVEPVNRDLVAHFLAALFFFEAPALAFEVAWALTFGAPLALALGAAEGRAAFVFTDVDRCFSPSEPAPPRAARTASAWPSTFTFGKTRATLPAL